MISCTEFIRAYNELFKLIERDHGFEAVEALWDKIRETFCTELDERLAADGIRGARDYWARTLVEEDADFEIDYDESAGTTTIHMKRCPSVARAKESPTGIYEKYCEHCPRLYVPLIEKNGLECDYRMLDREAGKCEIRIRRTGEKS